MKVYAQCLAQISNFIVKIVFKREIHTVNGFSVNVPGKFFEKPIWHKRIRSDNLHYTTAKFFTTPSMKIVMLNVHKIDWIHLRSKIPSSKVLLLCIEEYI